MLNGFTKEALFIYPSYADYAERSSSYRNKLLRTAVNVKKYLSSNGIEMHCFSSDDVAHEVKVSPDSWVITLNRGDMFFVQNNCEGGSVLSDNVVTFDSIYQQAADKYPLSRGMTVERRFEVVLKRDSLARRLIVGEYKFIILVKQQKSPAIRYTVKKNSGVVYLEIDNVSFMPKCWMSDMVMDVSQILGVQNAFMPVYEWEV